MKRGIWIGTAILLAAAASVPLWLLLNDGSRNQAALAEPTGSGDIGKLTISTVNGGAPISIRSFTLGVDQPRDLATRAGHLAFRPLEILRPIDSVSPLVLSAALPGTVIAPTAKLELVSAGKPYMTYELTSPTATLWRNGKYETLKLDYGSISKVAAGTGEAATAPASAVVGEMEIPALGKGFVPITSFETGYKTQDLDATKHQQVPLPIKITRAIDTLAVPLLNKGKGDGSLGEVTIRLMAPGGTTPYAIYSFKNALVLSVVDSAAAGSVGTQVIEVEYSDMELKAGANSVNTAG